MLWEHLVLDTLVSLSVANVSYWRDKQRREIDFVLPRGRGAVDAIECQWNIDAFETRNLAAFRASYPEGRNYLVSPQVRDRYEQERNGWKVVFLPIGEMRREFSPGAG